MNYFSLLLELFILKRNEKKTRNEIKAIRERNLQKLLLYAYDNSEYYRNSFEKAGIDRNLVKTLPLHKFPATDKNILIENFDTLVTEHDLTQEELREFDLKSTNDELFKGKYYIVHSSGSSEKPGYFVYDNQAWRSMLIGMVRGALWEKSIFGIIKYMLKKPRIVYIAATDGRYGGAMAVGAGINGIGAKQLFLDIKTPLDEWIKQLNEFKPNTIIGYPSAIKILAELAKNKSLSLNLNRIVSCGEPLSGALRRALENLFHTDVINFYGASESIALGVEGMTETITFGNNGTSFAAELDENETTALLADFAGGSGINLPIYHFDDYEGWEYKQIYDIPSRYNIPATTQQVTEQKAGEIYFEPSTNRIVLYYQNAKDTADYAKIATITETSGLSEAVTENPVLEGWGNKIISIRYSE